MATVTTPSPASRPIPSERIRAPLVRLRRTIRTYVELEGLALVCTFASLWFWSTLLLDWGLLFGLLNLDYLRDSSPTIVGILRGLLLGTLLLGLGFLIGAKIIYRLAASVRDSALALVFERRFPGILGDRLVTAVELADPDVAERYGYSRMMVQETTGEAAERVDKLAITDLFNWSRLIGAIVIALGLIVSVAVFAVVQTDTAAIWLERNVLLQSSFWPRQTMLELLHLPKAVPHGGEARVSLRAWKWVVATPPTQWFPDGWRPLQPGEVMRDGKQLPSAEAWELQRPYPTDLYLSTLPAAWRDLTLDELELRVRASSQGANSPEGQKYLAELGDALRLRLLALFDELDRRAEQSHVGWRREFRRLEVPDSVTIEFEQVLTAEELAQSKPKLGKPTVRRLPDSHDFAYDFKKVERPIRFRATAGDAATPWREIEVVPLPALRRLVRFHEEPGYLFGSNDRVKTGPLSVSLDGDESRFDVRSGSTLRLEADSSKPLRWVRVAAQNQSVFSLWSNLAGYPLAAFAQPLGFGVEGLLDVAVSSALTNQFENQHPLVAGLNHRAGDAAFQVALKEIANDDLRLRLDFEDTDGILGSRRLLVAAVKDQTPEFVQADFEIVRREMITDQAIIPFSGRIRDEHGLLALSYEVRWLTLDGKVLYQNRYPFRQFRPLRIVDARAEARFDNAGQLSLARVTAGPRGLRPAAAFGLARLPLAGPLAFTPWPSFEIPKEHAFELPTRPGDQKPLTTDDEFFDTLTVKRDWEALKPDVTPPSPPYRLAIHLVARDNYVGKDEDGLPMHGQESRSPEAFEFQVVVEEDLLIDAGKREEDIRDRFDLIVGNVKKARSSLKRLRDDFDTLKQEAKDDDFRRAKNDAEDVAKAIREGRDGTVREVVHEFRKIHRELTLNRVRGQVLDRIDLKICQPLEAVVRPDQHFARAEEAVLALAARLEAERAKTPLSVAQEGLEQTDRLIARLDEILSEMQKLIEFNQAVEVLRTIIKTQEDINKLIERMQKERMKKELEGDLKP